MYIYHSHNAIMNHYCHLLAQHFIYHSLHSNLVLKMTLPYIVFLPWSGRECHATPICGSPAGDLMETSAYSWSTRFDVMHCSGVHILPVCRITVCILQCDTWTQRCWEEGWDISGTLVLSHKDVAQEVSAIIQNWWWRFTGFLELNYIIVSNLYIIEFKLIVGT